MIDCWMLAKLWQRRALFGEFNWENVKRNGIKSGSGAAVNITFRRLPTTSPSREIKPVVPCFWPTESIPRGIVVRIWA